jgi:hypothetical protein
MEKTWKPTAAGILSIIGGVINFIWGLVFAVLGGMTFGVFGMGWLGAIGAPAIICGIIAIVGGIYALKRRIWGLALAGSICAIIGPGGIFGILATIFVALGKGEFE